MNMSNNSQYIALKMGNKLVFRDPLNTIRSYPGQNYNNAYQSNYNNQNSNYKKRNYEGMDVLPKFIANENMKEVNRELLERLMKKKNIFNKMMNAYFSENQFSFMNSLQEVEMEMNRYKDISENNKNKDFEGFMDLLSFMNCNRTNGNLTAMQNISLNDYRTMNYDTKKIVLAGIFENKIALSQKLNLKSYEKYMPNRPSYQNNMNNNRNNNVNNNMNNNKFYNQNPITKEQIELFKTFIGNPHISDQHVKSYFDPSNPKVILAANKYYKNIYGLDYLTLNYYYPYKAKSGIKVHKFKFTGELSELFLAAEGDFISVKSPRLFLENGKEIFNNNKVKCIGALNLSNNAKIKVLT
jgi:hypothetical protein